MTLENRPFFLRFPRAFNSSSAPTRFLSGASASDIALPLAVNFLIITY
jgi:hypothetical protein